MRNRTWILRIATTLLPTFALVAGFGVAGTQYEPAPSSDPSLFEPAYALYTYIQQEFYRPEQVDSQQALYSAMKGIVAELDDPYSEFLDPDEFAALYLAIEDGQDMIGIGIELGIIDGVVGIIAPLPGSPAAAAGVLPGDLILSIDQRSTEWETLSGAKERLRGAQGEPVVLGILHPDGTREEVTIVRDVISVDPVVWGVSDDPSVAWIRIQRFEASTPAALDAALDAASVGSLSGLILDLRSNPGGLLSAAIATASRFVDDGVLFQTVDRLSGQRTHRSNGNKVPNLPLVVLVDRGTAGASEIVAAAIRDNQMGVLAGERTFGLGVYQQVIEFADGSALKITTGEYLTPSGDPIDTVGIDPTLAVDGDVDPMATAVEWIARHAGTQMPLSLASGEGS